MLVVGQIHQEMIKSQQKLNDNTTSINDLLLKARALKLEKRGEFWALKNARKKDLAMFAVRRLLISLKTCMIVVSLDLSYAHFAR